MALANYTDLKAAIDNWMARSDLSGEAADLITLAEARLNREIPAVETDAILTGAVSSRSIDISSLSMVAPLALFLRPVASNEIELTPKVDGTFPYRETAARPACWAIDGTNIDFDCPLDQAYSFRFRYRQRFSLSDAAPTNWLLTNHPDVYLAAVIVWSGGFVRDIETIQLFKSALDAGIVSVKNIIGRNKRAVLSVDPALQRRGCHEVLW